MAFNDQEIQKQIDKLKEMETKPEYIEYQRIRHAEAVKHFRKFYVPLCVVIFVTGVMGPFILKAFLPGLDTISTGENVLISALISMGVAFGLYPRR